MLVFLLSKSLYPPTASSCPFSATQVERTTGRSVMVCHSWWSWASDIFASVVCDWRTLREQVMTIFVVLCPPPGRHCPHRLWLKLQREGEVGCWRLTTGECRCPSLVLCPVWCIPLPNPPQPPGPFHCTQQQGSSISMAWVESAPPTSSCHLAPQG